MTTERAWATLVNSEGLLDGNDRKRPKVELTETQTMDESKPQVNNFAWSNKEMEAMVDVQTAGTSEQMIAKEILVLVAELLDDIP